jgi:AcrR family transcriptional regulator
MQEIADEAGINKALVHYYYRSKEKLFEEVFREAFATLLPAVSHVFLGPGTIVQKISLFVEKYLQIVMMHPYIPMFVLSEMHRSPDDFFTKFIHPELKAGIKNLFTLIRKASEEGEIEPIVPHHLMINMMSLCVFPFVAKPMLERMLDLPDAEYQQMLEERREIVTQFIVNAITPKHSI